jgi:hypothetical protein
MPSGSEAAKFNSTLMPFGSNRNRVRAFLHPQHRAVPVARRFLVSGCDEIVLDARQRQGCPRLVVLSQSYISSVSPGLTFDQASVDPLSLADTPGIDRLPRRIKKLCRSGLLDVAEDKRQCPFAPLWTHEKNVRQACSLVSEAYLLLSSLIW